MNDFAFVWERATFDHVKFKLNHRSTWNFALLFCKLVLYPYSSSLTEMHWQGAAWYLRDEYVACCSFLRQFLFLPKTNIPNHSTVTWKYSHIQRCWKMLKLIIWSISLNSFIIDQLINVWWLRYTIWWMEVPCGGLIARRKCFRRSYPLNILKLLPTLRNPAKVKRWNNLLTVRGRQKILTSDLYNLGVKKSNGDVTSGYAR